jgi:hypothetical protein
MSRLSTLPIDIHKHIYRYVYYATLEHMKDSTISIQNLLECTCGGCPGPTEQYRDKQEGKWILQHTQFCIGNRRSENVSYWRYVFERLQDSD